MIFYKISFVLFFFIFINIILYIYSAARQFILPSRRDSMRARKYSVNLNHENTRYYFIIIFIKK